jgi:hypothetical protein
MFIRGIKGISPLNNIIGNYLFLLIKAILDKIQTVYLLWLCCLEKENLSLDDVIFYSKSI